MSEERFFQLLQEILTMVDPSDERSTGLAYEILKKLSKLAAASQKASFYTVRMMMKTTFLFDLLLEHRSEFSGKKGDHYGNLIKRKRLEEAIRDPSDVFGY